MPTRSIKFKLIVARNNQPESHFARQALWVTHSEINRAVDYYERLLLIMRGYAYTLSDGEEVTEVNAQQQLNELIQHACIRNVNNAKLSDELLEDIRNYFKQLYTAIVPSSIGEKGNAQNANAFIGILTDSASQGLLSVFDKIESSPQWLEGVRNGKADAIVTANKWLSSDEGSARLNATGAPPKWVKQAKSSKDEWITSFIEDFDRKVVEASGVPTIVKTLKEVGALPLFPPFLAPRIDDVQGVLSRWDRLSFRLAVAHLLSWESWCRICSTEYEQRAAKVESFAETYLNKEEIAAPLALLRHYEEDRRVELSEIALAMDREFRITRRMVRGWGDLRDKWLKAQDTSEDALKVILAQEQTRLRGKFGDPHLFGWLAKPENHIVWTGKNDPLTLCANFNALQSLLERSRQTAEMTLPDPLQHPRSVQWEAEGGSNLKNYIASLADRNMKVRLPLLSLGENGRLKDIEHPFSIAPSGQFREPVFQRQGNVIHVNYNSSSGEIFSGKMGAADLMFDWEWLRHKDPERVADGYIGPAFLKVSFDLSSQLPEGWTGKRPKMVNYFLSAKGNNKHQSEVTAGLRILSVDMGVRSFASCSVFELCKEVHPANAYLGLEGVVEK